MPSYVLSYVRPDRTAVVLDPVPYVARAAKRQAVHILTDAGIPQEEARRFGLMLTLAAPGTEITHEPSGLVFRIDPAEFPPNVCPCCRALVRPGDHAMAGSEDAYCLGCFTWSRNTPQCLPANTAHPEGYTHEGSN
jgi:hypothetical protein